MKFKDIKFKEMEHIRRGNAMKDDCGDIYFVLIVGIASFVVIVATGIYSTLRYGNF